MEERLIGTSLEHPQLCRGDQADRDLVAVVRPTGDPSGVIVPMCARNVDDLEHVPGTHPVLLQEGEQPRRPPPPPR